jgi:uncharacterized membrane protein YccC
MKTEPGTPFESIESAHEFVSLLADAVQDAKQEVAADVQREANAESRRRLEALRLTLYTLEKLEFHMNSSRRILNDLRSIRRLLFQERSASAANIEAKVAKPETPAKAVSPRPASPATPASKPAVAA